ncbi:kelch domain-containing protein [Metarhizium robertsii ARSEF 23]|uniref:Kelch domain-containing protein n=1 Tax=Metarhizium robertsii (strain ARSEF 23 / ATCC MYA-3075) TaxID=655844 RepID=A0A0B2XF07_METRA|nr:kelch domain-containing protein [Metarhizium robertsii ARSEF 23]KHO11335.1 kelch domain-containing protein [Metarhizium robertsii ARSEF 23]
MSTCRPFSSSRLSFSRITRIEQPALDGREWIYNPYIACFVQKARALYDANFKTDRLTVRQSLILMGWHWDGEDDVVKTSTTGVIGRLSLLKIHVCTEVFKSRS